MTDPEMFPRKPEENLLPIRQRLVAEKQAHIESSKRSLARAARAQELIEQFDAGLIGLGVQKSMMDIITEMEKQFGDTP